MIIATAGHVDHGKTTLVKALTGVDTDRLDEERRRGMTIDLGFAYADPGPADGEAGVGPPGPAAEPLGFVDVPGHERFVRNMLAGVAAVDLALLVVAADDGPMPQTREHLAIVQLLAVPRLVVALSKIDRVTPDRLAEARREVAALLADGPHAQAPVFALSVPTGAGVAALRQHLADTARALSTRRSTGHFRLAVDRSFLLTGAGRIVTGAVLSGRVQVGDTVVVSPHGISARVRGLHAQNRRADAARAGQRCALNLAGPDLKRAEPVRGDWVVAPAAHRPSDRLDVQLRVLAGESQPPNPRTLLQLHIGAAAVNARVAALTGTAPGPGGESLAQLVLDRPIAAVFGDRFILRDAAANRTLAGGSVVDPWAKARGRSRPPRLAQLAALALPDARQALETGLRISPDGVDLAHFAGARNLRPEEVEALQRGLDFWRVADKTRVLGLTAAQRQAWRERVLAALQRWHAEQPDSLGPDDTALRTLLGLAGPGGGGGQVAAGTVLRATLAALVDDGLLARDGLRHRLASHQAELAAADRERLDRVVALLRPAGLRPPIVGELAAQLDEPLPRLRDFLERMAQRGLLVRVAPNRCYLPETVAELIAQAHALAEASADGSYDAAGYRDRTGIGRNLTVQVLEFLDRCGITRFDGLRHRPLG